MKSRSIGSCVWVVLGIVVLSFPRFSVQTSKITDATIEAIPSTEAIYDYMVELEDNLWFHWNDFGTNDLSFQGVLIHIADSEEQAPTWLGFGVYHDNPTYTTLPKASDSFMTGSTCIIGKVNETDVTYPAYHYHLTAQSIDGILPLSNGTTTTTTTTTPSYTNANIERHDKGEGRVITYLSFTKNDQNDDIGGGRATSLRREGVNIFIWAVGPATGRSHLPTSDYLGMHSMRGVIFLDLFAVQKSREPPIQEQKPIVPGQDPNQPGNTVTMPKTLPGQCGSDVLQGNNAGCVTLPHNIEFHWRLVGRGLKIQIALIYTGHDEAWLGVATSVDGRMVGSSAVIGSVDTAAGGGDSLPPKHYHLNDQDISGVIEDTSILLEDTSITSFPTSGDSSKITTILQFTRKLDSLHGSIPLASNKVTFLYAVGTSTTLAYHEHRGSFQLNIEDCGGIIVDSGTWTRPAMFIAHGIFATFAWALATPMAISVAWFRTLVPTSWIYFHVFGNVVTFLATVIAFVLVVMGVSIEDEADHFSKSHHWIGLALLLLVTLQVMNGALRPPAQRKDNTRSDISQSTRFNLCLSRREAWQLLHRLIGLTAVLLGIYQIHSGLELYSIQFRTVSIVRWFHLYVGLFIMGIVGLKIWVCMEGDKEPRHVVLQLVRSSDRDDDEIEDEELEQEREMFEQLANDTLTGSLT